MNKNDKRDDISDEFDEMVSELIENMEAVDCPPRDFLAALRSAAARLHDRARSYAEEIGAQ